VQDQTEGKSRILWNWLKKKRNAHLGRDYGLTAGQREEEGGTERPIAGREGELPSGNATIRGGKNGKKERGEIGAILLKS